MIMTNCTFPGPDGGRAPSRSGRFAEADITPSPGMETPALREGVRDTVHDLARCGLRFRDGQTVCVVAWTRWWRRGL